MRIHFVSQSLKTRNRFLVDDFPAGNQPSSAQAKLRLFRAA
jgi:hypothetical protein